MNPTFGDWVSPLNYGLDQGPIVMMIENHRTGLVWDLMRRCPYIWRGLRKAGFTGGWLESEREPQCPKAVEGQWREWGTPFSKLAEGATPSERSDSHPTATMLAARIHSYGDPSGVKVAQAPRPEPGRGQVLVRVKAAGVNPLDWMVAEGKARSWLDHRLPLTLGWELAGTVEKLGEDVKRLKIGDEVFGMIDLLGNGAAAEFSVGDENAFAIKPGMLDFPTAAAVPVGALTAHQALFDAAELREGQTVLIHAAAGGVGSMAVQLAKAHGARVIGTASGAEHIELIRKLGCDEAIDYKTTRFEDHVRGVDVVLDPVSGDSQPAIVRSAQERRDSRGADGGAAARPRPGKGRARHDNRCQARWRASRRHRKAHSGRQAPASRSGSFSLDTGQSGAGVSAPV